MPTFFVMMKTLIFLFQILLLMACQGAIPTTTTTSTLLPFNPNIHHGVLANGLNYYILSNKEPENRVYMRLVVNAGSMNEDDDQKGVAHIVEHMAFNGSQKYPKNQIINALEQLGMKFARDINAFTDFENTVYTLNIAKNDDETLLLALDVINEWMNHLTILPEDLDSERGVVLEEWRARLSPMLRLGDKKSAVEMQGSRYVLRDPIGDVAVIKGVTTQRVRDFYQKWYRPDNMALIVVGDINKSSLENLIAQKLSNSTHDTQAPLPKIDYGIPLIKQWRVASVSEPEMTTSSLELSFFSDAVNKETEADYRKDLLQQIVQRLINLRLQQWENQQSAVINSANFYHSYLGKQTLQTIFSLQLNSPKYDKALDVLFHFISELKQQGFSQAELKAELERLTQRNEKESQIQVGSLKLANDLIPIIANGQVSLSAKDRYQLNRRLLKNINLAEIDRTFEEMIASQARLVLVTQPLSAKSLSFSADTIAQRWQQAMNDRSHHWKDEAIPAAMPELHFKAGTLMREKYWDKGNITEYRLSNGSKLVYHKSDKSPNQVYFKAVTDGGLRSIPNSQYHQLRVAVSAVDETGAGSLSAEQLKALFSQNPIVLTTVIDDFSQGFTGAGRSEDLENLLKLFRLKLQSSPVSDVVWNKYLQELQYDENTQDKETQFMQKMAKLRFPDVETVYSRDIRQLADLTPLTLSKLYQQYIRDKTDFTYFIVGDIDESAVKKLAELYLSSVEVKKQARTSQAPRIHSPTSRFQLNGFTEPRAEVELYLTADLPWQAENEYLFDILADILQERLRYVLRENAGGIYSVNSWFNQDPKSTQVEGKIAFSCAPNRVDELLKLTHQSLDSLVRDGIDNNLLKKKLAEKESSIKQQFDSLLVVFGLIEESYRLTDSPNLIYRYQHLSQIATKENLDKLSQKLLARPVRFEAVLTQ